MPGPTRIGYARAVSHRDPQHLLGAVRAVADGRMARARATLDAASTADAPTAHRLAAARLRALVGDYHAALEGLTALARERPEAARHAHVARARLAEALGWSPEARQAYEAVLALAPDDTAVRRRLIRLLANARDHDAALALMADHVGDIDLRLKMVELALGAGSLTAARTELRGLAGLPAGRPERRRIALLAMRSGELAMARATVTALLDEVPGDPVARWLAGRMALWAGKAQETLTIAEALLDETPGWPPALTLRGAARLLDALPSPTAVEPAARGLQEAIEDLDAALEAAPHDGEARIWRGQALAAQGRSEEAIAALDPGVVQLGGFVLAARILRYLLEVRLEPDALHPSRTERVARRLRGLTRRARGDRPGGHLDELARGLEALGLPGARVTASGVTRADAEDVLGTALRRLGGNRTAYPTRLAPEAPEGLARLELPPTSRAASRWALELIRVRPYADALAAFDGVMAAFPDSPMPLLHRGELHLWMGQYEAALADFQASTEVAQFTRWAFIGPMAALLMMGRPEEAMRIGEKGLHHMRGAGPSHHVYYGEALRAAGRLAEGREPLEQTVAANPTRLGARVSLAVVLLELGHDARGLSVLRTLAELAPGLVSDAATLAGLPGGTALGGPGTAPLRAEQGLAVARAALGMLRGNRSSSCITYFGPGEVLRLVERPDVEGHRTAQGALFDRDSELATIVRLLAAPAPRHPV